MNSTWPIVLGIFALVAAAFWYDATIASTGTPSSTPVHAAEVR
jgi:hypothetical protein